jgi:hypothetical protein
LSTLVPGREESHFKLNVYPVPANDYIIVEFSDQSADVKSIELLNFEGGKVITKKTDPGISENRVKLNVSCLQKGIYFVRIITNKGSFSKKVIVE